jgi:hypothetical protein
MKTIARQTAALAGALMLFACSDTPDPATASDIIVGEWEKPENSLPPVNLVVTRYGDGDRARLRLSGVERNGTVTLNGNRVVLHFPGIPDINGEILSRTELRLDFTPVPTSLRKRGA